MQQVVVEISSAGFVIDVEDQPERESMAAAACAQVVHFFDLAGTSHARIFDVKFADNQHYRFAEIEFGLFQRVPEFFGLPQRSSLLDWDD